MIRRPPRSTLSSSSAASDVYKRQVSTQSTGYCKAAMVVLARVLIALCFCMVFASSESMTGSETILLDEGKEQMPSAVQISESARDQWPAAPRRHRADTLGESVTPCKSCATMSKIYGIVHPTAGKPPQWGRANDQAKGCWIAMDCDMSGAKVEFQKSAPGLKGFHGKKQPTQSAPHSSNDHLERGQISEMEAAVKPVDAEIVPDTVNGVVDWESVVDRTMFSTVQVRIVGQTWDWKSPQSVPGSQQWSGTAWFVSHQDIGDGTVVEDPNELLLITNAHVAADALYATIMVPSAGSHPIEVDVIGTCVARDLAMLRVKNPADLMNTVNWKPAMLRLGDSDKMKRAGQVMVLGYPLGLAGVKASMGFVSGYQQFEEQLYLQVTAPIDGGNSGGPLLDELGEVVGVVSAKIAQASGMSFAIPAVELKALLHVLYTRRAVYLPLVGLSTPMVTSRHARDYFGVSAAACTNQSGLLIDSVMPSSLLSGAGVQPGDVLLSLDGASVDRFSQVWVGEIEDRVHLTTFLARKAFGEELSLHVWRGDKLVELQVVYDSTPALAVPQIPELSLIHISEPTRPY
eukprot:TRINITY_DN1538_c0_g1_i1.p1 TRINITY_DN1538_c0_g1~~TRINITY_DN1538_c0_g1_i1.p1  ORF type:complete len:574 (-),score=160.01 TRINITY_DN1538_c0_g1_i1:68-1789(-)